WVQLVLEVNRRLFTGDFAAAETKLRESLELRETRGAAAQAAFELQRFVLRREQGRLTEIDSELEACADRNAGRRVLRCALANLSAELGRTDVARDQFDRLAVGDFAAVPLDGDWLVSAALLAETCRALDDSAAAASLYDLLLPYSTLNVSGEGEVSLGAVSRYLGHLAAVRGRPADAVIHFEEALEQNARMGAEPWLAHTQHDLGEILLEAGRKAARPRAHELIETALATYRVLGVRGPARRRA